MDPAPFDDLLRHLSAIPTRRGIARALAGLAIAGTLGSRAGFADSEARNKKKKKCAPCKLKKNGKCKRQRPDDTACNGDGRCFAGSCIARPTCLPALAACCPSLLAGCSPVSDCCSGHCLMSGGYQCFFSAEGDACFTTDDCFPGEGYTCVAYRCRVSA